MTDRGAATRERILTAAAALFTEHGVRAVSTNRVAAAAGVSPGNLYYWYADRESIVRALYDRFLAEHDELWASLDGSAAGLERLRLALAASAGISARYRWLVRDLVGLVHADPELERTYRRVRTARLEAFGAVARAWRAAGLVRDVDDERLADVVEALWVIAETWWPFAELDEPEPDPQVGARLARAVLEPYLTGGAR
ncbi:MAG TPA: TetR/AcrR family transcriptional regulator [Cellulomonas sp.]